MATWLSCIAIVLSIASLGWQAWTWRHAGPVVSVTTGRALPTVGGQVGEWLITVTASNTGRLPAQVTGWGLELPGGGQIIPRQEVQFAPPLPHQLAAHSSGTWYVPYLDAEQACAERGISLEQVRGRVSLGSGKTVRASHRGIGRPQ